MWQNGYNGEVGKYDNRLGRRLAGKHRIGYRISTSNFRNVVQSMNESVKMVIGELGY